MRESGKTGGGIGVGTVLLIVFVVLKLTDNVTWSWVWVLSPCWIVLAVVAVILAIVMPFKMIDDRRKRRQRMKESGWL